MRPINQAGAHCKGHNHDSIGICLIGGRDNDNKNWGFTSKQFESLQTLIDGLRMSFGLIPVYGHREFTRLKTCPCFNVNKKVNNAKPLPEDWDKCKYPDR